MRAIVVREFGDPSVLHMEELPVPERSDGQLLVRVDVAGVLFADTQIRHGGIYPNSRTWPPLPWIPGWGVGGAVVEVSNEGDRHLIGTPVVAITDGSGGYADFVAVDPLGVIPKPEGLGMREAVALVFDGRTALRLCEAAELTAGMTVLVYAAAGSLGYLLVQRALALGARVIAAARGAGKRHVVAALGAVEYVDYAEPGWVDGVLELTAGEGVDVIFDGVGGELGSAGLHAVRRGGRVLAFGMASGAVTEADNPIAADRGFTIVNAMFSPPPPRARELSAEALALAAAGELRPFIGQVLPLEQAELAHAAIDARRTTGKTLLEVRAES